MMYLIVLLLKSCNDLFRSSVDSRFLKFLKKFFFYFILFYFILFYFILFYFILFYFTLFYFILFYFYLHQTHICNSHVMPSGKTRHMVKI